MAKYQGRYQIFQEIRQRYALKWTSRNNSLQTLQRFFNPDLTLDIMLQRIHEMIRLLPTFMGKIIKFGCLVGLHPAEVVESVKLINDKEAFPKYYDYDKMTLCHYKFSVFLRTTKKAYVSFVTSSMLKLAFSIPNDISYNAIRLTCQRKRIKCDMRFTRKVYGSWLHQSSIASENIDFLQGRVNPSVFSRHYLTPSQDLKGKVIEALEKLQQQLD